MKITHTSMYGPKVVKTECRRRVIERILLARQINEIGYQVDKNNHTWNYKSKIEKLTDNEKWLIAQELIDLHKGK